MDGRRGAWETLTAHIKCFLQKKKKKGGEETYLF